VAMAGVTSGLLGMAQRVTWRARHFGVWQSLTSEITAMDRPAYFQDTMIQGAFRFMKHDRFFRALSPHETEMKDTFCFEAPLGVLEGWPRSLFSAVTCRHCFSSGTRFLSK
jgi:ligand-binding SRPBCC domain-containing protein